MAAHFSTFCWQSSWTHWLDCSVHHGALRSTYGTCQWWALCIIVTKWSSDASIYVFPSFTLLCFYLYDWTLFYKPRVNHKQTNLTCLHRQTPAAWLQPRGLEGGRIAAGACLAGDLVVHVCFCTWGCATWVWGPWSWPSLSPAWPSLHQPAWGSLVHFGPGSL